MKVFVPKGILVIKQEDKENESHRGLMSSTMY